MRKRLLAILAGTALCGAAALAQTAQAQGATAQRTTITVAAAADLKFALEEVKQEFAREHPEILVNVIYGSSGNFFAQISNKAPFDMFLSADMEYPQKLAAQGLAAPGTLFPYGVGRIVLWTPKDSKIDVERLGVKALLDPAVKKIAIANPAHAPYGRAAEAAMKSFAVYDQVKDKLVYGENVAQTAQYLESAAADIGFIALSLANAPAMKAKGRYWEVPLSAYPRMDQGGVILASSSNPNAAGVLRLFLTSPKGRAILKNYGFFLPETNR
jgi:molybdate transport system substrate-binding protein